MLRSSLGFHTLNISSPLMRDEAIQLIKDFKKYNTTTQSLKMYYMDPTSDSLKIYNPKNDIYFMPNYIKIYYKDYNGIKWSVWHTREFHGIFLYKVSATINPKMMGGLHDYLTAATYDDIDTVKENFNIAAKRISPLLKNFSAYKIERVDYCINFDLRDFMEESKPELIINLIKRGNIPAFFKEYTKYNETSHRTQSMPGSFYLINNSVHINCYSKYMQLEELSKQKIQHGDPPIPQSTLDIAYNIIRFEVQYKWFKLYSLSRKMMSTNMREFNRYEDLLSYESCREVISQYFNKTIIAGDWWTLKEAIRIISSKNFHLCGWNIV